MSSVEDPVPPSPAWLAAAPHRSGLLIALSVGGLLLLAPSHPAGLRLSTQTTPSGQLRTARSITPAPGSVALQRAPAPGVGPTGGVRGARAAGHVDRGGLRPGAGLWWPGALAASAAAGALWARRGGHQARPTAALAAVAAAAADEVLPLETMARCWAPSALSGRPLGPSDPAYTQAVLRIEVDRGPDGARPLGLDLQEVCTGSYGRGLVLVAEVVEGGAVATLGEKGLRPGDTIVQVGRGPNDAVTVEGRILPEVVEALGRFAGSPMLSLWVKRLIPRGALQLTVIDPFSEDKPTVLTVPAGRKLDVALIEADLMDPLDGMNCGGDGTCGVCAVDVVEGAALLTPTGAAEAARLRRQPPTVRLACQARAGAGNQSGEVTVRLLRPK